MEIPLTRGYVAIVDASDYARLSKYKWHAVIASGKPCAVRSVTKNGVKKRIKMHRQITKAPDGLVVDHINRNPLDNRLANLRVCPQYVNATNTPNVASGVSLCRHTGQYHARISWAGKRMSLGRFAERARAEEAVKDARQRLWPLPRPLPLSDGGR